jgi:DNA polymerase-3 subunit beta
LQEPSGVRIGVEAGRFAEAVSQVGRAASRDEARPVLTGVLLEVSREGVVLVATDSYRLSIRELVASADAEAKAIVPERALAEAGRAASADEKGSVELFVDDSQVSFKVGGLMLTSRLIEGEFPNYRQLLPETHESRLEVSRQQLLDAVRRVGLLARDTTPVRLEFNALGVKLSSSSPDLGQAVETVEARYEGEDLTVAFNPQYLADGLTAANGETVRVDVRDGLKPGVVRGDGDEFTYLVMPVRLPAPVS